MVLAKTPAKFVFLGACGIKNLGIGGKLNEVEFDGGNEFKVVQAYFNTSF